MPNQPADEPKRESLLQGTYDDDLNPYPVSGEVLSRQCPKCGKALVESADVCKHCGHDFAAQARTARTYSAVDRQWQTGWSLSTRLALFAASQALNLISSIARPFAD